MASAFRAGKKVKPKKRCCKSGPRCKRCPIVLRRLTEQGFAEERSDGRFVILEIVPKKRFKAARKR